MTQFAVRESTGQIVAQLPPTLPLGWSPPEGIVVQDLATTAGRTWEQQALPSPQPVPESVTASTLRLRLIQTGVGTNAIDEAISRIEDATTRESVRAWWQYEYPLRRDSPMLARWAVACGFSDADVDDLFRGAAEVQS
jgi:hypothetical protein